MTCGESFERIFRNLKSKTWPRRSLKAAIHEPKRRIDDVIGKPALARFDVGRVNELRMSREHQGLCASNPKLRHRSHPKADVVPRASFHDAHCRQVTTDPLQLDVDDIAGATFEETRHVLSRFGTFVQTDRRSNTLFESSQAFQIIFREEAAQTSSVLVASKR